MVRNVADAPDVVPKVVLATVPDWPTKSRWFFEVNDTQFEANEAIRAKVAEITRGLKTDDDKIAAIVHWSADEIRYAGMSMGQGEGYTFHPGPMIFDDRSGVCKDKAGMAITMLRAAGCTPDSKSVLKEDGNYSTKSVWKIPTDLWKGKPL